MKTHDLARNPMFAGQLRELRAQLIARLREDGYDEALEGDGWKKFRAPLFCPPTPITACCFRTLPTRRSALTRSAPITRGSPTVLPLRFVRDYANQKSETVTSWRRSE